MGADRRTASILGVENGNGFKHEGERRPADLEDVFVQLTGEEISCWRSRRPARGGSAGSSVRR